ncbi:MAG: zinc-ribbon domain-containing protein [Thaumarchaeota archaeon]|nr:zinc-ribbon domain-containing protein [Nitrososphaerota archaeon]
MTAQPSELGIKQELSLGEVISKTFQIYRRDFTKYFILFAVVEVIIGIVTALAHQAFVLPALPSNPTPQQVSSWLPGFFGAFVLLIASTFLVTVVFFPIAQGSAIKMASERIEKGQAELGVSIRFAAGKLIWIWILTIVVGILVFLGLIALIVPGIILAIMFALAFPVLLIENKGIGGSMGRSRELVGHRWLKTFATYLVLGIIVAIAATIVSTISSPFGVASPVVSGILSAFYQPLFPILLCVYYYSNLARISPHPEVQMTGAPAGAAVQAGVKYCPNCGTQLSSTAIFCTNCGARVDMV